MGIREIARQFHHSRQKVREVLRGAGQPRSYRKRKRQSAPKLGPFYDLIRQILAEDESAPPKQRHTAVRIFERLRDEHAYRGGFDSVRRFVKMHRTEKRETFIPLDHDPGQRLEADFGKIYVDFPDGRRQVSVLILVWSYSNAPFAVALPTERTEAILEGMVQAFEPPRADCSARDFFCAGARSRVDHRKQSGLAGSIVYHERSGGTIRQQ
jgi:transposase